MSSSVRRRAGVTLRPNVGFSHPYAKGHSAAAGRLRTSMSSIVRRARGLSRRPKGACQRADYVVSQSVALSGATLALNQR